MAVRQSSIETDIASGYFHRPLRVSVEGNIGSGKTTFLDYCLHHEDMAVVPEPVSEWTNVNGINVLVRITTNTYTCHTNLINPFISYQGKYYEDPSKWGVTFQMLVGLTAIEKHLQGTPRPIQMTERSISSSR